MLGWGVMLTYGGAPGAQGVTWRCIQGSEARSPASRVDTIAWLLTLTKMSQIRKSFFSAKLSLAYSFGRWLQMISQKEKLEMVALEHINSSSFGGKEGKRWWCSPF